jgi:hypothetical protein
MCYNDNTLTGSTFNYSTPSCGTSGSSEPSWNTTRGQTTDDGVSAMWLCISVTDVIFDSTSLANAVVGLGNVASLYITSDNITNTVDVQGGIGSAFYQTFSPQYYFPVQGICFGGDKECGYGATGSLETINNGAGNQGLAAFKYGSFIGGAASQNFGFQGIFHAMEWGMGTDYQYGYFYLKSLSQPTAPTCTVVGTPGAVAYDYWVVAHIGNTTAGAIATGTIASVPSATCTVYPPTSMNSSNYVAIVPPVKTGTGASDSYWSASYDVLKETSGTTPPAHSILTNVQLTKNTSGVIPFKDIGQSSTAYTALTTASQPGILMDCKPVGNLPAAASGNKGMQACVSDSTTVSAEGQTCTGGSNVTALAFSNGSAWKCF